MAHIPTVLCLFFPLPHCLLSGVLYSLSFIHACWCKGEEGDDLYASSIPWNGEARRYRTSPPVGGCIIGPRHSQFFEQWKHFQRELYVH